MSQEQVCFVRSDGDKWKIVVGDREPRLVMAAGIKSLGAALKLASKLNKKGGSMGKDPKYSVSTNRFRNFYRCEADGTEWQDDWDCTCNSACPTCNTKDIQPYRSVDLDVAAALFDDAVEALRKVRNMQFKATERFRKYDFVFRYAPSDRKPETDAERWEAMAFALYTDICDLHSTATVILEEVDSAQDPGQEQKETGEELVDG
jgi:hypothetical protein